MDIFVILKGLIFCMCVSASIHITVQAFKHSRGSAMPMEGCLVGLFCLMVLAGFGIILWLV